MNPQRRKQYRLANLEKEKAYNLNWNRNNRARLQQTNRNYIRNPRVKELRVKSYLKRTYGLTIEQYNQMFVDQQGLCAICGVNIKLVVDHCHDTQEVRGLVCSNCNSGLGFFKDNVDVLVSAINYLKRFKKN
jgi:hypothetical protein